MIKPIYYALAAFATLSLTVPCYAQNRQPGHPSGDSVDNYIDSIMAARHIPGLALAIVKDAKVLKEACYGIANLELNVPVKKETVFEIASMSKQFTCAAVLLLQQEGKLSIQDRLSKHLDNLPDSWKDIHLYQLMNHTAGLRDDWEEDTPFFMENHTDSLMFARQKAYPLLFPPGEAFHYGSGPFTLGLVIAKVSGLPYAQFMKERIFEPLGMHATSIYDVRQIIPNRAAGYVLENDRLTNGMDISSAAEARGDVGVITTIEDMIKWNAALDDDRLLTEASRKAMFTPGTLNDGSYISYGYGWFRYPSRGNFMLAHTGGFRTGFNSVILRYPDKKLFVVMLCNLWSAGAAQIVGRVVAWFDQDLLSMSERTVKPDPAPLRSERLKELMSKAARGTWQDKELYKQANFCGDDAKFLAFMLKGFKDMVYVDTIPIKNKPFHLFGEDVSEVLVYRADADRKSYWSVGFNREGKLVYVAWEE
jgi:CubicO group peptidase (beta-lactamase class C family)